MKRSTTKIIVLAVLVSLFAAHQTSCWSLKLTNWTISPKNAHIKWAGSGWFLGKCFSCCDDHVVVQPGQTVSVDAKECLLTRIDVDGASSYTSSGQRTYDRFHIIEVGNTVMVGRIQ